MNGSIMENAIENAIKIHEQSIGLLKTFHTKCRHDGRDMQFIFDNCETLRHCEKLINLYQSILEETVSVAHKSGNQSNDCASSLVGTTSSLVGTTSSLVGTTSSLVGTTSSLVGTTSSLVECDSIEPVDLVEQVEEKYRPSPDSHRTQLFTEQYVNLTAQHVTFKEAVTVVHYPNEMDETTSDESSSMSSTGETRTSNQTENLSAGSSTEVQCDFVNIVSSKKTVTVARSTTEEVSTAEPDPLSMPFAGDAASKPSTSTGETESLPMTRTMPKLFGFALRKEKRMKKLQNLKKKLQNSAYDKDMVDSVAGELNRDGKINNFQRSVKQTTRLGQCFLCDKRMSCTKLQWQKHLLSHTKENFLFCKQCGHTFMTRLQHKACPSAVITTLYDRYECVGDDYLAAFVCKICSNYVRVSESRMVKHMNSKHSDREQCKKFYEKCKFVVNI